MKRIIIPAIVGLLIGIYIFTKFQTENITEHVNAIRVDLSDSSLLEVPQSIFYATKLERLNLSNNSIRELPDKFDDLQELRYLDLSDNSLNRIPKSIGTLQKLEYLDISDNPITELPELICSLKNLKVLKARYYSLKSIPDCICEMKLDSFFIDWEYLEKLPQNIASFDFPTYFELSSYNIKRGAAAIFNQIDKTHPNLKQLKLRYPDLDSFPTHIGNLEQLRYLNLMAIFKDNGSSQNPKKRALPDIFEKLTKLETFISQTNHFSSYPPSFQQLTNLRYLCVDDYLGIDKTLYPAINNFSKLEYLKLETSFSGKEESIFPFDLGSLQELKTLDLNLNSQELPKGSISNLEKLEYLKLEMPITHFEEDLSSLKKLKFLDLNLYRNKESDIKGLSLLENLEKLILSTDIQELPNDFGKLQKLHYLDINLPIEQLPESLADLDKLDTFYCRAQFTSGIPNVIHQLKNLKKLHLSPFGNIYKNEDYNTSLDPNFVKLQNLQDLHITHLNNLDFALSVFSKLDKLKDLSIYYSKIDKTWQHAIQENKSITQLDIRNSQLETLPDDLGKLKGLEQLNLYRNAFTVFPVEVLNTNIKDLDLSYNQLQVFPEKFNNSSYVLEELDLSNNNMTEIPVAILEIETLKSLNLKGNNFESFDPSLFKGKLPILETLIIGEKWGTEVQKKLQEYLPDCNIYLW